MKTMLCDVVIEGEAQRFTFTLKDDGWWEYVDDFMCLEIDPAKTFCRLSMWGADHLKPAPRYEFKEVAQ